jgi:hypothetical protein
MRRSKRLVLKFPRDAPCLSEHLPRELIKAVLGLHHCFGEFPHWVLGWFTVGSPPCFDADNPEFAIVPILLWAPDLLFVVVMRWHI